MNGEEWRKNCKGFGIWCCKSHNLLYDPNSGGIEGIIKNENQNESLVIRSDSIREGFNPQPWELIFVDHKIEDKLCDNFAIILSKDLFISGINLDKRLIAGKFNLVLMNECGETKEITNVDFQLDF